MIYDVDIVAVPAQTVLSIRAIGPLSDIGVRMRRLRELAAQADFQPAAPMTARFYEQTERSDGQSDGVDNGDVDYDVALPVQPRPDDSIPDAVEEACGAWVPLHHVLQAVHHGPHTTMGDAWAAVREAASVLGYTQAGPVTEVYQSSRSDGVEPADFITLVRLPYAR